MPTRSLPITVNGGGASTGSFVQPPGPTSGGAVTQTGFDGGTAGSGIADIFGGSLGTQVLLVRVPYTINFAASPLPPRAVITGMKLNLLCAFQAVALGTSPPNSQINIELWTIPNTGAVAAYPPVGGTLVASNPNVNELFTIANQIGSQVFVFMNPNTTGGANSHSRVTVSEAHAEITYTALAITTIFLNSGGLTGHDRVVIHGNGFSEDEVEVTNVFFDGVPATNIRVFSSQSLSCDTPEHAQGRVNVTVEINNGTETATLALGFLYMELSWTVETEGPVDNGDTIRFTSKDPNAVDFEEVTAINVTYIDNNGVKQSIAQTIGTQETNLLEFVLLLGGPTPPIIVIEITSTQFSGSVALGALMTIFFTQATGIYQLMPGKSFDTLYNNDSSGETIETPIPRPFAKTGYIGG